MLKVISSLWKKELADNCIIFGPKNVLSVWEKELKALLIPYRITDDIKPVKDPKVFTICLINYEKLKRYKKQKFKSYWDIAIADESHRIKNRNSVSSKVVYKMCKGCEYKFGLSGTPMGNSEIDFWAQYRFINPEVFGEKYSNFDKEFFKPCGYMGYDRKFRSKIKKELFYQIVNDNSFRITKNECLDLPSLVETVIPVELKCKKAYDKLEKELILKYTNKSGDIITIEAPLAITLVCKLQQLCCGFIYDDEHNVIPQGDDSKLEVLLDLLESGQKTIIFCKYTWEIDSIAEKLKDKYKVLVYDGRTKDRSMWQKFDSYDVMVAQIKSGGTGLNLQCASQVIFYSLPYSYIDVSQAKDRVYRNGQKNKVTVYYLLGKDTIEENIYNVISRKLSGAHAILDDFRKSKLSH